MKWILEFSLHDLTLTHRRISLEHSFRMLDLLYYILLRETYTFRLKRFAYVGGLTRPSALISDRSFSTIAKVLSAGDRIHMDKC